jgi:hypothetical protein
VSDELQREDEEEQELNERMSKREFTLTDLDALSLSSGHIRFDLGSWERLSSTRALACLPRHSRLGFFSLASVPLHIQRLSVHLQHPLSHYSLSLSHSPASIRRRHSPYSQLSSRSSTTQQDNVIPMGSISRSS